MSSRRDQLAPRSTQPGLEERSRVEVMIPPHDQPLPPPMNKPAAASGECLSVPLIISVSFQSREELLLEMIKLPLQSIVLFVHYSLLQWATVDKENNILKRELYHLQEAVPLCSEKAE